MGGGGGGVNELYFVTYESTCTTVKKICVNQLSCPKTGITQQ